MAEGFNPGRRRSSLTPAPWDKSILSPKTSRDTGRKGLTKGKFLCLITGAGNGLGRAIAGMAFQDQGILPNALSGSKVILIDKDEDALKETSGKKMRQFLKHRKIEVELEVFDLSDVYDMKSLAEKIEDHQERDYEQVIFVNNASDVGDTSKTLDDYQDPDVLSKYWNLNITSRTYLSCQFARIFKASKRTFLHTIRMDSTSPETHFGPSCMATSAVKAFTETLAMENPKLRVLEYHVGLMETNRTLKIVDQCGNEKVQKSAQKAQEENKLEQPLEVAKRIIKYIEGNDYTEGKVLKIIDEAY
ncbi:sepiapterin reductase-like [Clytia hemisphaerica]|uniref:sepiapterin reductase-like n=1 Tax=Clytia hemisphaerica TaxID=252671 RepID=UPI0034D585B3